MTQTEASTGRSTESPEVAVETGSDCVGCVRLRARAARERRARVEAEGIAERFARDALHDPLTGLANRALLLDRLELALARAARNDGRVGLLFLDLDGFKAINDQHGHGAGDRLLIELAARLTGVVRAGDLVARQGGDEFVLLCEEVQDEVALTELAEQVANAACAPWLFGGQRVVVTVSVGVRLAVGGERADVVLRDADVAMYEAKTSGGSRWVVFDTVIRTRAAVRAGLEADLRRGLQMAELETWYQPVVDLATGEVTGAEALARWQHPSRGLVMPDEFILTAEESGLIRTLGAQVLQMACRQAVAWRFPQTGRVLHVNTTAKELSAHGFPTAVANVLQEEGMDAGNLCLEITERQLVDEHPLVQRNLEELRRLGVALAIDDFGTEYASFSYLRRLPVDALKIDRSFVREVDDSPRDAAIVGGIVAMARALGIRTVAEGVETAEQAGVLRHAGVDEAQGWRFGRPCTAAVFTATWIRDAAAADPAEVAVAG